MIVRRILSDILLSSFLLVTMVACNKSKAGADTPSVSPVVRPVGQPLDDPETFVIDSQGGSFTTSDQRLHIEIPAGAVSGSTPISIQPVGNTCPGSLGVGYSLTPHGTTFAKPVILEFSYAADTGDVNIPEALGIAYQDKQGIWRLVKDAVVDQSARTVRIQTTHFSDWSLLQWLKLLPVTATVATNGSLGLHVTSFVNLDPNDLLVPLISPADMEAGLGEGYVVPPGYIKKWSLGGVGNLNPNGAAATYTAPSALSQPTTVAVSAELNSTRHQLLVVSNLTIIPDGITFRINGGAWKTFPGTASASDHNGFAISSGSPIDNLTITLTWQGSVGSYRWNSEVREGPGTILGINDLSNKITYDSYYIDEADGSTRQSVGTLRIDELGSVGGSVTGSFFASPAGRINYATGEQVGTVTIKGYFNVKRVY